MGTPNPMDALQHTFADDVPALCVPWEPQPVAAPRLLAVNEPLAAELGLDVEWLRSPEGVAVLAGNAVPNGAHPVAMAYAGHQFGGYSPRLGDGRALLLGELLDGEGRRRDVHLKGSGRTPFARGGDGRAAVGPMLREFLMGEAMHALGVPTTRMLAVVATGESIVREANGRPVEVPGAVLTRVAASHLRVGTFQYAAAQRDPALLEALLAHAIARHAPECGAAAGPGLAFYEHVIAAQASLVARWMEVGFIHGVMNTDNMALSGETIDYGPCAFMDAYDPAMVFSSIDHGGRYAFGNQPSIAGWNLARLAEAMLPLLADTPEAAVAAATELLEQFSDLLHGAWADGMRHKLGIAADTDAATAAQVAADFLGLLATQRVDLTMAFRSLAGVLRGDAGPARGLFTEPGAFDHWCTRWTPLTGDDPSAAAAAMDRRNPAYIPRNHLVEDALAAASEGDLGPFDDLLAAVRAPFTTQPDREHFAAPAAPAFAAGYRTFCGT